MRLHRFFVGADIELKHDIWIRDERLIHQWRRVLRFQPGQEVVLFDGRTHDRLYRLAVLHDTEAHVQHVTDLKRTVPTKDIYLFWSLLKKDKNDWVLQKGTELGVSHFVPLLADRSEKTGFSVERAQKIIIEAAEQCGRSDIPSVREPILPETMIAEFRDRMPIFICEQSTDETDSNVSTAGVCIGPEGGWSDREKQMFAEAKLPHIAVHDFTLRAETAALAAIVSLRP